MCNLEQLFCIVPADLCSWARWRSDACWEDLHEARSTVSTVPSAGSYDNCRGAENNFQERHKRNTIITSHWCSWGILEIKIFFLLLQLCSTLVLCVHVLSPICVLSNSHSLFFYFYLFFPPLQPHSKSKTHTHRRSGAKNPGSATEFPAGLTRNSVWLAPYANRSAAFLSSRHLPA